MEQDISDLGKEIARLERQEALDAELSKPVGKPITGRPSAAREQTDKPGRASENYKQSFWNLMRSKAAMPEVVNALQIGTDSEGGYLVPDEFERTLVESLEEENIFRQLAKVIQTPAATARFPLSLPRVRLRGSTRRARSPRATTPLVRYPSARTNSAP
jgi:HK97 family phage major capsid protein